MTRALGVLGVLGLAGCAAAPAPRASAPRVSVDARDFDACAYIAEGSGASLDEARRDAAVQIGREIQSHERVYCDRPRCDSEESAVGIWETDEVVASLASAAIDEASRVEGALTPVRVRLAAKRGGEALVQRRRALSAARADYLAKSLPRICVDSAPEDEKR